MLEVNILTHTLTHTGIARGGQGRSKWILTFGFFVKKEKSLQMQRKIPFSAAHNPETIGSSPTSATIKTTVFKSKTVVFLCFMVDFSVGNVDILMNQLFDYLYVFSYAFTALKNCSMCCKQNAQ